MPTVLLLFGKAAKFQVEPEIRLMENHGIKAQAIKKAMELIETHREKIISAWHKSFDDRK